MSAIIVKTCNRERTERKLLEAIDRIIEEYGIQQVGVNLVSKIAGVNKVLLYRYFGGIEGAGAIEHCIDSVLMSSGFLCDFSKTTKSPADILTELVLSTLVQLRSNKQLGHLLQWAIQ
ncbi:MAG: helix-turn-helix domain-containing protein [Dyadobacter sp.]